MPAAGDDVKATDVSNVEDASSEKAIGRIVQQSAQSIPSQTTPLTAVTFGLASEEIDTHGFHDEVTNNTRITPSKAGYYRLTGTLWLASVSTTTSMGIAFTKNGAGIGTAMRNKLPVVTAAPSIQVSTIVSANGTTDYFEMTVFQVDSGAAARNTATGASTSPAFEWEYMRDL